MHQYLPTAGAAELSLSASRQCTDPALADVQRMRHKHLHADVAHFVALVPQLAGSSCQEQAREYVRFSQLSQHDKTLYLYDHGAGANVFDTAASISAQPSLFQAPSS